MSQRYEVGDMTTDLEILGPGADLGGNELGSGAYALVIGDPWASAYAIEGTLEELAEFAQRVTALVAQAQPTNHTGNGDDD